ncbi:MAG: DUF1080 domain-containing protein [Akkermansiaceae bacterium]
MKNLTRNSTPLRRSTTPLRIILSTLIAASAPLIFAENTEEKWTNLFNGKDLNGWHAHLGKFGDESSQKLSEIFTVKDGTIHIYDGAKPDSKQASANLYHESEWSHFHLQVEYRWLEPKFQPRTKANRDAGILFHVHSQPEKVWPPSLEMQLGDGKPGDKYVTGDLFVLGTTRADSPSKENKYQPDAPMVTRGRGAAPARTMATEYAEKPLGEWNLAEVIVHGSKKAEFILNGKTLNVIHNFKYLDADRNWKPLEKGHISIQAEWAELQYRTIRVKKIKE